MAQEVSTRVQLTLEQIGEDEALTGDLTDSAATALLEWITQQVQAGGIDGLIRSLAAKNGGGAAK